jgi:ketopantoate reductase
VRALGGSQVEVELAECLLQARWKKLCWNMPFNGLGVVLGG